MSHVSGPFIEFDCTKCGGTVRANAQRDREKLGVQVAELEASADLRICAGCWNPTPLKGPSGD